VKTHEALFFGAEAELCEESAIFECGGDLLPGLFSDEANGAVEALVKPLATELAPIRVNALSPGIVDSGAWDRMGDGRDDFFSNVAASNPARRIGQPADISSAALLALTNPFITGTTLHVDGGGRVA